MTLLAERHARLWMIAVSPAIWAGHFMASYIAAAVWCGRLGGPGASLLNIRLAIAAATAAALIGVAIVGVRGYRAHTLGGAELPHDDDSPIDRHRFIGFSTLLLSGLSAVAIVYTALPAVFIEGCQ